MPRRTPGPLLSVRPGVPSPRLACPRLARPRCALRRRRLPASARRGPCAGCLGPPPFCEERRWQGRGRSVAVREAASLSRRGGGGGRGPGSASQTRGGGAGWVAGEAGGGEGLRAVLVSCGVCSCCRRGGLGPAGSEDAVLPREPRGQGASQRGHRWRQDGTLGGARWGYSLFRQPLREHGLLPAPERLLSS